MLDRVFAYDDMCFSSLTFNIIMNFSTSAIAANLYSKLYLFYARHRVN